MLRGKYQIVVALALCLTVVMGLLSSQIHAQRSFDVRVERWLAVQQVSGDVKRLSAEGIYPAEVNDRLTTVGDGIRTEAEATSILELDTGIGTISLRENTEIIIQEKLRPPRGSAGCEVQNLGLTFSQTAQPV